MKISKDRIDPEIYWRGRLGDLLLPQRNEQDTRRIARLSVWLYKGKTSRRISCREITVPRHDGGTLRLCVYAPLNRSSEKLPGLYWTHGGGYAVGTPEGELSMYERFIDWSPCVIVSPAYRLSVEAPYPAAAEDCYDGLKWFKDHTEALGVRSDQLFLGGGSAGGGLAAALALMARDRGKVRVAFQMPIYPMLDNTMSTASMRDNDCIGYNEKKNAISWKLYLGENYRSPEVSKYASPLRETDFSHLPPAFSYVGDCDPFLDETKAYMAHLQEARVEAKLIVYPGGYHAFEQNNPNSRLGKQAFAALREAYLFAVNHYFAPQEEHG